MDKYLNLQSINFICSFHLHSSVMALMSHKCPLQNRTRLQSTPQHEDNKLDQAIISFSVCICQKTDRQIDIILVKTLHLSGQDTFQCSHISLGGWAPSCLYVSWLKIIWKMYRCQVFDKFCWSLVPFNRLWFFDSSTKSAPQRRKLVFTLTNIYQAGQMDLKSAFKTRDCVTSCDMPFVLFCFVLAIMARLSSLQIQQFHFVMSWGEQSSHPVPAFLPED